MKNLLAGAIGLLFCFVSFSATAQNEMVLAEPDYNKPKLFQDVPQKFSVNIQTLESLLNLQVGETVNVQLTTGFPFHGVVVSKSDPSDPSVQSVVMKSTNRQGAGFTFTKVKDENNSYRYLGRIISFKNSDAFELTQENGQYMLVKKHQYDLFNE